jgi:hypothetical protein
VDATRAVVKAKEVKAVAATTTAVAFPDSTIQKIQKLPEHLR